MPTENWWFWFERNPSQHFIAAIRRVFLDFEPVDAGWDKLGMAIQLRACKTVDQVRSMQPHDVELFLDLYWPPAVAAATPCNSAKEEKRLGAPEHEDNELEEFLFNSWTTYSNDPNLVDRPVKSDWLQTLPEIRDEQNLAKKRQLTKRYMRLLRNTLKRHADRKRKLKPQTPRTKQRVDLCARS